MATNEEGAKNSRQLKGLKWKTQKALDGEGKDPLVGFDDEGNRIVNLGKDASIFSEGSDGSTAEMKGGQFVVTDTSGNETVLSGGAEIDYMAASPIAAAVKPQVGETYDLAVGYASVATGGASVALGTGSSAPGTFSVALGAGSNTTACQYVVSFDPILDELLETQSRTLLIKSPEYIFFRNEDITKDNKNRTSLQEWTSGQTLTAWVDEKIAAKVPTAPTTDGTYTLQCVVSSGAATYTWVAA